MDTYEKKYNEALERAKAYHRNELAGSRKEMMEYIFPQLRESEDEENANALIRLLNDERVSVLMTYEARQQWLDWLERKKTPSVSFNPALGFDHGSAVVYHNDESEDERIIEEIKFAVMQMPSERQDTKDRCLAWLEKQKENPKSADFIPSDCVSDAKCENRWHKTANSLPDDGRDVLAKDALGNYLLASFDGAQWFVSVYDGQDHPVLHTPPILEWCDIETCEESLRISETCKENADSFTDEDERIRKWLVDYFKAVGKSWIHRDISPEQIVAYLEKQKEIPMPDSTTLLKMWEEVKAMLTEKKHENERKWGTWRIAYNAFLEGFGKGFMVKQDEKQKEPENTSASTIIPSCWEVEQKEQKPISQKDFDTAKHEALWEEKKPADDTTFEKWLDDWYQGSKEASGCVVMSEKEFKNWSRGIKNMYQQKLDIALIQRSWYMEGYHDREFGKEPMWIIKTGEGGPKYELNPKYGQPLTEQKPAEWSEEDNKMRLEAIRVLESGCERYRKESGCLPGWHKVINWLKSLRPSWKPSEEQMEALAYSIQILDDGLSPKAAKAGEELEHLRDQLKKL